MSEAKGAAGAVGSRLAEVVTELGALYMKMERETREALRAAGTGDTDAVSKALDVREDLIRKVNDLQQAQRELMARAAGGPPPEFKADLETLSEPGLKHLKDTVQLNSKLESKLVELKQQVTNNLKQIAKLKETARGYRPRETSPEGLFVDSKR